MLEVPSASQSSSSLGGGGGGGEGLLSVCCVCTEIPRGPQDGNRHHRPPLLPILEPSTYSSILTPGDQPQQDPTWPGASPVHLCQPMCHHLGHGHAGDVQVTQSPVFCRPFSAPAGLVEGGRITVDP